MDRDESNKSTKEFKLMRVKDFRQRLNELAAMSDQGDDTEVVVPNYFTDCYETARPVLIEVVDNGIDLFRSPTNNDDESNTEQVIRVSTC